jgi:hypothetical protein
LLVGVGVNIPINKKFHMSFEVRDHINLTTLSSDNKNPDGTKIPQIRLNSVLLLYNVSYHLPFLRKKH